MKDPTQAIEDAIITLLDGNVSYNGKAVKPFRYTPEPSEFGHAKGALYHFVEVGEVTDVEIAGKAVFHHDTSVEVEVVVGYPGIGSKAVHNNIVNQVTQLLKPTKQSVWDLGADYQNYVLYMENKFELQEQGTHKVIRTIIRYRLEIKEL